MKNKPKFNEGIETAVVRWTDRRMSGRCGYYSGRGPNSGDLNNTHLESIWKGIKSDVGDDAAQEFVKMVTDLEDMSASAFLVSLERLMHYDFKWTDAIKPQSGDRFQLSSSVEDGGYVEGLFCIGAAFGNKNSPDMEKSISRSIKAPFLMSHGVKVKGGVPIFGYW